MELRLARRMITGGFLTLFLCSSLGIGTTWASRENTEIIRIKPSRFNTICTDFLNEFQTNFPQKPSPPPEKDEFETSSEYEVRRGIWENNYEKTVTEYREQFSKTAPVYELYDLELAFGTYNADKGYFETINSSRLYVVGINILCDGYKIDASCPFGPMERYAHITIKNVSIKRETAKALKAITSRLRMRAGFQLIPPYPKDKGGKLQYYFHHVSIYDATTGETLFTITDQPIREITHGR